MIQHALDTASAGRTHTAGPGRLFIVEWRSSEGMPWICSARHMQDTVFTDQDDAYEYAEAADHGQTRIVTWKRECVEILPDPSAASLPQPVDDELLESVEVPADV